MFTPLTGGTLIKFHRDLEGSSRAAWSVVFDLHRFLDLALHVFFVWHFPWRVDHLASLVSHSSRYLGHPWSAYENIVRGQAETGVLRGLCRSVCLDDHLAWMAGHPCCPFWTADVEEISEDWNRSGCCKGRLPSP